VHRADNLTPFMCQLSSILEASTSWNPQGLSRPVMGLLYLHLYLFIEMEILCIYIYMCFCLSASTTELRSARDSGSECYITSVVCSWNANRILAISCSSKQESMSAALRFPMIFSLVSITILGYCSFSSFRSSTTRLMI